MRYLILQSVSPTELMRHIEERLNNGWKLEGGVAVDNHIYSQAITKAEEQNDGRGERRKGELSL